MNQPERAISLQSRCRSDKTRSPMQITVVTRGVRPESGRLPAPRLVKAFFNQYVPGCAPAHHRVGAYHVQPARAVAQTSYPPPRDRLLQGGTGDSRPDRRREWDKLDCDAGRRRERRPLIVTNPTEPQLVASNAR